MTKKGEQFLILEMAVFGVLSLIFSSVEPISSYGDRLLRTRVLNGNI